MASSGGKNSSSRKSGEAMTRMSGDMARMSGEREVALPREERLGRCGGGAA